MEVNESLMLFLRKHHVEGVENRNPQWSTTLCSYTCRTIALLRSLIQTKALLSVTMELTRSRDPLKAWNRPMMKTVSGRRITTVFPEDTHSSLELRVRQIHFEGLLRLSKSITCREMSTLWLNGVYDVMGLVRVGCPNRLRLQGDKHRSIFYYFTWLQGDKHRSIFYMRS